MAERGTSDDCLRSWRESVGVGARAKKRARVAVAIFGGAGTGARTFLSATVRAPAGEADKNVRAPMKVRE